MKEKLRFRPISKLRFSKTEVYKKEVPKDASKSIKSETIDQQYLELPVYDISFEKISLPTNFESLNTEVKEVAIKRTTSPLFDTFLAKQITTKPVQIPATDLIQIHVPKETLKIADIKLFAAKIDSLSILLNTDIGKDILMDKLKTKSFISSFDLELESKTLLKQSSVLDTELITTNVESSLETFASPERQAQLPLFEEFINCNKRFPRGFSESFNSPFVVLIGEDKYDWHIPIIFAFKELFCEITDKHPRVTFREPEVWEEGMEEHVDSVDPHSLDQFTFEFKIELLDARRMHLTVNEFVKVVKGRLKSGFLQQFGVLIVAVKPKDLEKAKNVLKLEGLRVYTCLPDDGKYELFCTKILGVNSPGKFFSKLRNYERYLEYTYRIFSIFVKRDADATDKLQYPLKVATFVYLLNDLRNRRKKILHNFEELCEFVNEVLNNDIIKVEEKTNSMSPDGKAVIPDIIYSPEGEEIYVEIETLIGTFEPLKKVDETIEKYKNLPSATLWIVLKPVSAMLHYEEIKVRKKAFKVLYNNIKIEFKVLTLLTSKDKFRWNLVNIDEFIRGKNVK